MEETDLVLFAGPVVLKAEFSDIPWEHPTVVRTVQGSGSGWFSRLAEQLRGRDGRILPTLLARYAPGIRPRKIALCAYSAGHGLLNKVFQVREDLARVDACVLNDATFDGFGSRGKDGYVAFGMEAARGKKLMVSTTANTSDGTHLTGRDSWKLVWKRVARATGKRPRRTGVEAPMPRPSGGAWRLGSRFYWYDYADASGRSDISHGAHHDLAPETWEAYLAPYLGGSVVPWGAIAGLTFAAGGSYAAWRIYRRRAA